MLEANLSQTGSAEEETYPSFATSQISNCSQGVGASRFGGFEVAVWSESGQPSQFVMEGMEKMPTATYSNPPFSPLPQSHVPLTVCFVFIILNMGGRQPLPHASPWARRQAELARWRGGAAGKQRANTDKGGGAGRCGLAHGLACVRFRRSASPRQPNMGEMVSDRPE